MTDRQDYDRSYRKEYRKSVRYASIALPNEDYERIAGQAARHGLKPAAFMRALILERSEQVAIVPPEIHEELKDLRLLIRNIANNVNQMAHYAHIIRHVDDEQGLFAHLRALEEAVISYTHNRLRDR